MSGTPARLRLVMTSEHVNLERAVDQAESFFNQHLVDEELVYNLMLMASEAVTNGMEHGNAFDAEKEVIIEYMVFSDHVMISVEDEGPGFERSTVPDPLGEERKFASGGRGLFLMEHICDEVRYEAGGRRIHLRINLAGEDG